VIFTEIGGPIVYIDRTSYRASKWADDYPVGKGGNHISPQELWDVLRQTKIPLTVISHSPGDGRMGTDWRKYDRIDHSLENVLEIYQGARFSYESKGVAQPTVGLHDHPHPDDLQQGPNQENIKKTIQNEGTYQTALKEGHRLGVMASSDHISTSASYGGVFAKTFSRKGIVRAINNRHTIAATDKIRLSYTCNGRVLGSAFTTGRKPTFNIELHGTAPVERVVLIRNETNYKVFNLGDNQKTFEKSVRDETPKQGMNRYYLRVVQSDGNMAWASPVWVTYEP